MNKIPMDKLILAAKVVGTILVGAGTLAKTWSDSQTMDMKLGKLVDERFDKFLAENGLGSE